ncbi:50S ribosomal protein L22 [Candidatus Bandiella numerosa]|jgi:large subunit ribosomal protein L22|uniref:50S ribosomal protein L22 n=1 Tax=Candidatus Bandiella numerosa TaxID=2570586 RepID=UPI00249E9348|nr:50S ribosomal protein L22 [Candidatus Bandiella numerosa]WHA05320.1 50S ribosomal protein L22 [Candidatus Bandiella numerosa]
MVTEITENNYYINEFMQVKATDKLVKSSVQKLNIIADLIRKENVNEAILQLEFCKRKASKQLQNVLKSAIANSQNNHGLDIDKLYVKEVRIGKSLTLKRSMVRARGRINRIVKPFSKVTIIVEERG